MSDPAATDNRAEARPARRETTRPKGVLGYDRVRTILGLLLLVAALLKAHQLATEPVAETSLLTSRWFLLAAVEFELALGLGFIAGFRQKVCWCVGCAAFLVFAATSLYRSLSGEASCGCFGRISVSPWAMFVLDLLALSALVRWRPNQVMALPADSGSRPNRIAEYESSHVDTPVDNNECRRIALIEMPPLAASEHRLGHGIVNVLHGRLTSVKDWFVTAPVVLALHDGVIVSASVGGGESLASLAETMP